MYTRIVLLGRFMHNASEVLELRYWRLAALEVVPHGFPNADMLSQLACIIFNLLKISQLDPQVWPCQAVVSCSTGVIWHPIHFETPVIPAKAGIHFSSLWKRAEGKLESRFHGNDCAFERPGLANDTTTSVAACEHTELQP
ncbi:MAG: hypothetical protein DMG21_20840 [Acidobacteria bacterium]|nr:MAG: hypothetical protein DMG21_20840 [Acidobacteriota bacterium]